MASQRERIASIRPVAATLTRRGRPLKCCVSMGCGNARGAERDISRTSRLAARTDLASQRQVLLLRL
jgi:hypothetical protein